jgi:hypothetical protein
MLGVVGNGADRDAQFPSDLLKRGGLEILFRQIVVGAG